LLLFVFVKQWQFKPWIIDVNLSIIFKVLPLLINQFFRVGRIERTRTILSHRITSLFFLCHKLLVFHYWSQTLRFLCWVLVRLACAGLDVCKVTLANAMLDDVWGLELSKGNKVRIYPLSENFQFWHSHHQSYRHPIRKGSLIVHLRRFKEVDSEMLV
jgi:hypothetical protein